MAAELLTQSPVSVTDGSHQTEDGNRKWNGYHFAQALSTSGTQVFGLVLLVCGTQEVGFQEEENITLCEETGKASCISSVSLCFLNLMFP